MPLALQPQVDRELDKFIYQGILVLVDHADWETPIVIPLKQDRSMRICTEFKCTINKALQANPYLVPIVQHVLHLLGHRQIFTKLDLAQAYQQLPVDEKTALAQTIVTHHSTFKCTHLQFGVCIAPGIFQSIMERLLQGIPRVVPYFDNIIVSAANHSNLPIKLWAILMHLCNAGLKLKCSKCAIGISQVEFLGFLIDGQGIHPTLSKIAAIKHAQVPSNQET